MMASLALKQLELRLAIRSLYMQTRSDVWILFVSYEA